MRDGWRTVALDDIAWIQQGRTLATSALRGGEHPVYGANGVIGWHDSGHYPHHVVALGCRGSCGTVHLAPPGAWLANNVMGLWAKSPDELDVRYLALTLQSADLIGTGVITGQVQPQITRAGLAPLRVPLLYPRDDPARARAAALLAQETAPAGIVLTPQAVGSTDFSSALVLGQFDLALSADGLGPDPDDSPLLGCDGVPSAANPNGLNDGGYCSPQMDSLLQRVPGAPWSQACHWSVAKPREALAN